MGAAAAARFAALDPDDIAPALTALSEALLAAWLAAAQGPGRHAWRGFDPELPAAALAAIRSGHDHAGIAERYQAPIATLQACDLALPEPSVFAYYALYNAFRRCARGEPVDARLVLCQAIAALGDATAAECLLQVEAPAA